jgi:uncharacterized protein (DUF952 family)
MFFSRAGDFIHSSAESALQTSAAHAYIGKKKNALVAELWIDNQ